MTCAPPTEAMVMKPVLITVPVGNNPSRVRMLLYHKGLEADIDVKTPADYGGLSAPAYRKLNPQGKIPVLLLPDGSAIYESRVITAYLVDKYAGIGPSLVATTPELRARVALIVSIHDLYIASPNSSNPTVTANQACAYKPVELIDAEARSSKLTEIAKQCNVLEGFIVGPYAVGDEPTEADMTLYPTLGVFLPFLVHAVFGWPSLLEEQAHPNLSAWLASVEQLPAAKRVKEEMLPALQSWETNGRFDPIRTQIAAAPELPWGGSRSLPKPWREARLVGLCDDASCT